MAKTNCAISVLFLLSSLSLKVFGTESGVPLGHMKPFGGHMPPEKVDELTEETLPSPQDFWKNYVSIRKPVVFRGIAKRSPSFSKWTDEYLKENYGDMEVRLEARKEKQGYIPVGDKGVGRDTVKNFVNTYHTANKYIVSELPSSMYKDFMVFPPMSCGEMSRRIVEVDWWMNGGKAGSIIHKDAYNQINCLMNGTKEWKLIEYKYEKEIYKSWEPENQIGGYSRLNPNKVDLKKYPKVAGVPWKFTTMNAGDCLYLPGSMYHQVNSNGTNNFALSLLFSRFDGRKELDFTGCPDAPSFTPLSNLDVDWQYPGTGLMTMGAADIEGLREMFAGMVTKKGQLSLKRLRAQIKYSHPTKDASWITETAKESHAKIMELAGGYINKTNIDAVPKDALRIFGLLMQQMDASNRYDHEYTYVRPEAIMELLASMTSKNRELKRDAFSKRYQKILFGTADFANRIFDIIAGKSSDTATVEQVKSKSREAVAKFFENQREPEEAPEGETTEGDAYDGTNTDTEMQETGMPDMSEDDEDTGMPDMSEGDDDGAPEKDGQSKDEL